ncbi:MAG: GAF domain-containing protein [Thermoplasmata archaeon]
MEHSENRGIGEKMSSTYMQILERIANFLRTGSDPVDLYQDVCDVLQSNFDHYTWVGIYVIEGNELVLKAYQGPDATERTKIPIGEGICGLAAQTTEIIVVPDVSQDSRYLECFPSTKAEIVVPIKYIDDVFGEIDIDSDDLDPFTEEDQKFLRMAADQLAAVVKKLRA